jgi:sulfur carrier protein
MQVLINGECHELAPGTTLAGAVAALGGSSDGRGVAVALDGEVVPRRDWTATELTEGARVELVVAVQGG